MTKRLVLPAVGNGDDRSARILFARCKSADTPRALGTWLRFKYGELSQLVQNEVRPNDYLYHEAEKFAIDYGITEYYSKSKFLKTKIDKRAAAFLTFRNGEEQCRRTNVRLRDMRGLNPALNAVLFGAQRKIADLLGACPSYFDFAEGMWGPGETKSLSKDDATLNDKLLEKQITVSRTALPFLAAELGRDLHWANARGIPAEAVFTPLPCEFLVTDSCRVTTAPKNSKTDRTIAIEPTGNIFLQKGVGRYIRRLLRKVGIDLDDQSVNQRLAKEGAISLLLATLDLKAASDTIAYELVAQLLPYDWFCLLDRLRSQRYDLKPDEGVRFEKFSTMGNGFTFELESLLFWAITKTSSEAHGSPGWCAVYGDDIICHTNVVPAVVEALEGCGFTLNLKKSHYDSPFRESCGAHYFGGYDVTPIFQKDPLKRYEAVLACANRIHRRAVKAMQDPTCLPSADYFKSSWLAATHGIDFVDFVPLDCEEDTGLAVVLSDLPHTTPVNGGVLVRSLIRSPARKRKVRDPDHSGLALWLRTHASREEDMDASPPGRKVRPDVSHVWTTTLRKRYFLNRKVKWYPGAADCGFRRA